MIDCVVLSISSAVGQLFIFFTIEKFGAVVFTIMMTVRQVCVVLLFFTHSIMHLVFSFILAGRSDFAVVRSV